MLTIRSDLLADIVALARDDHPVETCGVIAGLAGSDQPDRLIPMRNAAQSQTFFRFDPREQLRVWRAMEERGEDPLVIYHSHTQGAAYPSREDIALAGEPGAHYLIVSTVGATTGQLRSFRIVDGRVTEEAIHAVPRYSDGRSTPVPTPNQDTPCLSP